MLVPNGKTLFKIANALHVTIDELLNEPENETIKIELVFGKLEDEEKEVIDMTGGKNLFKLFFDDDGQTIGIRGAAKFKDDDDIADFALKVAEELQRAFKFQKSRCAVAGAD